MHKNAMFILLGALVVVGGVVWYSGAKPIDMSGGATAGNEESIRALVTEFGTKLQLVSLLAPANDLRASMDAHYSAYVAPQLLAQWLANPAEALGRKTSSPWPDRIDVVAVEQIGEGMVYRVEANIVEADNTTGSPQPFAVQPVSFDVEQLDGRFVIVGYEKGSYSQLPQRRSVVGYWECLPHQPGAPQTEECLTAIAIDQSDGHIALDLNLMSAAPVSFDPGTKVRVEGVFTPAMALSSSHWQNYILDGVLSATTIEKVEPSL